jgi:predicted transcriptional regulator of viral defense system
MSKTPNTYNATEQAKAILSAFDGVFTTAEVLAEGIHPRNLYELRDSGFLEELSRGVFRIQQEEIPLWLDLMIVSQRVPNAVVCLLSALSYHDITTQIPHRVYVAIPQRSKPATINFPPTQFHTFSKSSYETGIETHRINKRNILHVYNPEKTIADCFKFRNQIGMDVVLEALKMYRKSPHLKFKPQQIMEYAKICRVHNVILPYLETLTIL